MPCNMWLNNITIKNSPNCDYCNNEDNLPHYFIICQKIVEFLLIILIGGKVIEKCILFGFLSKIDTM